MQLTSHPLIQKRLLKLHKWLQHERMEFRFNVISQFEILYWLLNDVANESEQLRKDKDAYKQARRYFRRVALVEAWESRVLIWLGASFPYFVSIITILFQFLYLSSILFNSSITPKLIAPTSIFTSYTAFLLCASIITFSVFFISSMINRLSYCLQSHSPFSDFLLKYEIPSHQYSSIIETIQYMILTFCTVCLHQLMRLLLPLFLPFNSTAYQFIDCLYAFVKLAIFGQYFSLIIFMLLRAAIAFSLYLVKKTKEDVPFLVVQLTTLVAFIERQMYVPYFRMPDDLFQKKLRAYLEEIAHRLDKTEGSYRASAGAIRTLRKALLHPGKDTLPWTHELLQRMTVAWLQGVQGDLERELANNPPLAHEKSPDQFS